MKLIGDPHLGREFKTGVPLHRRGEREEAVRQEFRRQLLSTTDLRVMVGDLFDSPHVSRDTVKFAIDTVLEAGGVQVHMAGNHDRSRQTGVVSGWDLFVRGVRGRPGIHVVETPTVIDGVLYLPWEWGRSALEQLEGFDARGAKVAVCHHDLESFGGNDSHMLPAARLAELGIEEIYTGHWHLSGVYEVDGIRVVCTGSMLPYSHAEDPDETTYITRRLEDLPDDLEVLKDKVVRIRAPRGADIPEFDCLALTVEWDAEIEAAAVQQAVESFDLKHNLTAAYERNAVPPSVQTFIEERLSA